MNNYKITNITNLASKRDSKYNSSIDIEYIDDMSKKIITIKPNESIILSVSSLPLSVHRLRVKNFITVVEISKNQLNKLMNVNKNDIIIDKDVIDKKTELKQTSHINKKKFDKKDDDV